MREAVMLSGPSGLVCLSDQLFVGVTRVRSLSGRYARESPVWGNTTESPKTPIWEEALDSRVRGVQPPYRDGRRPHSSFLGTFPTSPSSIFPAPLPPQYHAGPRSLMRFG